MGRFGFGLGLSRWLIAAGCCLACVLSVGAQDEASRESLNPGDRLIVETIQRIDGYDLKNAPDKVKKAVEAFLDSTRGTPEYLDFVRRYSVTSRASELAVLAGEQPEKAEGVQAVDLLLKFEKLDELSELIHREDGPGIPLIEAVGLSGQAKRLDLLEQWIMDEDLAGPMKERALRAMGNTGPGAKRLLALAASKKIPGSLVLAAANTLFASTDPAVIKEAEEHFSRPATVSEEPLPPVGELVKMKGTLSSGKTVFGQICVACHQVGDVGLDYGPALTEIGNKLAKEALYTAILDPNEAISFGYEGFTVKTRKGTEFSGFIASETADQISLKLPGGLKMDLPKKDIQKKAALPMSLMPANLQASLTTQQLVDLVEYLASLKGDG